MKKISQLRARHRGSRAAKRATGRENRSNNTMRRNKRSRVSSKFYRLLEAATQADGMKCRGKYLLENEPDWQSLLAKGEQRKGGVSGSSPAGARSQVSWGRLLSWGVAVCVGGGHSNVESNSH